MSDEIEDDEPIQESTFTIRVNDGPEQTITVKTGVYQEAAAAVPALLGVELPCTVEIWVPRLLPDYGPYLYGIKNDEFVNFKVVRLTDLDKLPPKAAAWWRVQQEAGSPMITKWPPQ